MRINAAKWTVNGSDQQWSRHSYVLWFGCPMAPTKLLVYADSLDSALEECGYWLEDNAPGVFCNDMVSEEYQNAIDAGKSEEEADELATIDVTILDRGNYILSYEWGMVAEDPTREELAQIFGVME